MLKQVSAFAKDSKSIGNIATRVIANEADKMERKGCNINFDNCKGHEL